MFNIELFENAQCGSESRDFIKMMDEKALMSDSAKHWMEDLDYALAYLEQMGTWCGEPLPVEDGVYVESLSRPVEDGIYVLRVGKYRVPYWQDGNTLVLSHIFYENWHKEIEKAKKNREDWKSRH